MTILYYTTISLETICKNGSEKYGANACTTISDKPDGLFMAVTQHGKTKIDARKKLVKFLKSDGKIKLVPVLAKNVQGKLKKHLKSKGFSTSIKAVPIAQPNAGCLIVELKGLDEHLFFKELKKVCWPGERVSPGTYVVDPVTIKIGEGMS